MIITFTETLIICSISFLFMELAGPFNILSKIRNMLMLNSIFGVFFYKLFSCAYCSGFWAGIITYFLFRINYNITDVFIFGLFGAIVNYLFRIIVNLFISLGDNIE